MKKYFVLFLVIFFSGHLLLSAQNNDRGVILRMLETAPRDTNLVWLYLDAADSFYFSKPDSCLMFALQGIELAKELKYTHGEVEALRMAGEAYRFLGDYPKSLEMQFRTLQFYEKTKNHEGAAGAKSFIGFTYLEMGEYRQALQYLLPAKLVLDKFNNTVRGSFANSHIGSCYALLGMPDSALYYNQEALRLLELKAYPPLRTLVYSRLGNMYENDGKFSEAINWYHQSLYFSTISGIKVNMSRSQKLLANLYFNQGQIDSAIYYARLAYANSMFDLQKPHILDASVLLSEIFYRRGDIDSAFYYQRVAISMKDSIYGVAQFRKLQLLMLEEQEHEQAIVQEQTAFRNKIKIASLVLLLGFLAILAAVQRRNNLHKQKINRELENKKENLEKSLSDLRSAQAQLIQSEKMASLGELTAGIAHEIQNPLNFVNNFAEINNELIEDLREASSQQDQREVNRLADQLQENEARIKLHGKRADSIVKSMLQHSRAGSGIKELIDINKLVDEYVRLSFHGMRAKDKSFNAELDLDLEPSLGKINILPQDFGRVLLNLLNNAFYAVNEKRKISAESFKPKVSIKTTKSGVWKGQPDSIQVIIADNGNGIPSSFTEKIFQPFFTTKPTGDGTGLGLSLSYDIITNAHGGSLTVDSREGEGAAFTIQIPLV
jgi:two-component system, NtrC family, sensor kinase